MRLIDADVLPRHKQLEAMGNGKYENVEIIYANDIDNAPTIDAVPVRHGRWEKNDDYTCSLCGYRMVIGDGAYNYCPNCGAQMER